MLLRIDHDKKRADDRILFIIAKDHDHDAISYIDDDKCLSKTDLIIIFSPIKNLSGLDHVVINRAVY